jgi:hypothetical protein
MKQIIFTLCLIVTCSTTNAQKSTPTFIQINASIDALGNIRMSEFEIMKRPPGDSIFTNRKQIMNIVYKCNNAIDAINALAKEGWIFISAVSSYHDEKSGPSSPFVAYYFRKD